MTDKVLIDIDPLTGSKSIFEYDGSDGTFRVHEITDVSPTIEQNKLSQNDGTGGWNDDKSFRHVARIPPAIVEMWRLIYGVDVMNRDHWPAVKRLLNDPDWKNIRSANWKV